MFINFRIAKIRRHFFYIAIPLGLISCKKSNHKITIEEAKSNSAGIISSTLSNIELPTDAISIGSGFNSATLEGKAKVVKYTDSADLAPIGTGVPKTVYDLKVVKSYQQLFELLNLSSQVSLKMGAFKGSASIDVFNSTKISDLSEYLFVKVEVSKPIEILKERHLTDDAIRLLKNNLKKDFLERFGDQYIYGLRKGGIFLAVFEYTAHSYEEKKSLHATLNASVSSFFASAQTSNDFSTALNQVKDISELHVHYSRAGDDGALPNNNIDSIVHYASRFPNLVLKKPAILSVYTEDILNVSDLPLNLHKEDFRPIFQQSATLQMLGDTKLKLLTVNDRIESVVGIADQLRISSEKVSQAKFVQAENLKYVDQIDALAKSCYFSINSCQYKSNSIPILDIDFTNDDTDLKQEKIEISDFKEYEYKNNSSYLKYITFDGYWTVDMTRPSCIQSSAHLSVSLSNAKGCSPPIADYSPQELDRDHDRFYLIIYTPGINLSFYNMATGIKESETTYFGQPIQLKPMSKVVMKPTCYFAACGNGVKAIIY